MTYSQKATLTKINTAIHKMRQLTEQTVRLEQELKDKPGPNEISLSRIQLTSDLYPCTPDEVLVSCGFDEIGSAKDLTILSPENFKKLVTKVDNRILEKKSSWRTLPGINHLTEERQKIIASSRESLDFTMASEFEGLFVVKKSLLTEHRSYMRDYGRLLLTPKENYRLIAKIVQGNKDILKINHHEFFPALQALVKNSDVAISSPAPKCDYIDLKEFGFTRLHVASSHITAFYRLDYDALIHEIKRIENCLETNPALRSNAAPACPQKSGGRGYEN